MALPLAGRGEAMEALNPIRLVHYFDTQQHRIACGAGIDHRSTKHARSVTCQKCMGLLRAKGEASQVSAAAP
jgi:hypothetical protein